MYENSCFPRWDLQRLERLSPAWVIIDGETLLPAALDQWQAAALSPTFSRSHLKHLRKFVGRAAPGPVFRFGSRSLCFFPKGASNIRFPLECNAGSP
ncbi:hypothetical protein CEXT_135841 [Caerostris extrusa]|uniref:Uncharacterized protein n=1 Tax=Caerostris extrusa TaxID=172846 RepID=A0AAV4RVN1_CAEEX|nr:hypothetical protein CEXT_135841 [Caerostris extrusa]